jgi:hypothetical protein
VYVCVCLCVRTYLPMCTCVGLYALYQQCAVLQEHMLLSRALQLLPTCKI